MSNELEQLINATEAKVRLEQENQRLARELLAKEEARVTAARERAEEARKQREAVERIEALVQQNRDRLNEVAQRLTMAVEQNVVLAELEFVSNSIRTLSEAMRITSGMIPQLAKRGDTKPLLVQSERVKAMLDDLEQQTSLSRFMERAFNEDELGELLMGLGGETLEDFRGATRSSKIVEIVLAYQRRGELGRLEEAVRKARPNARY